MTDRNRLTQELTFCLSKYIWMPTKGPNDYPGIFGGSRNCLMNIDIIHIYSETPKYDYKVYMKPLFENI